jgi:hypothetical protein
MKAAAAPELPNKHPCSIRLYTETSKILNKLKGEMCKSCSLWEPNRYNIQIECANISVKGEKERNVKILHQNVVHDFKITLQGKGMNETNTGKL